MPTMQDLVYSIEANTQGLQAAFAPIEKLEKTLNSLAKSVRSLTKTFTDQMNAVAQVQNTGSSNVQKNTNKIVEQLKRQQAALINSTQKLLNLNQTLGKTGASTKAIDANVEALRELDKILKDGTISSADATLARAKFNAVLSESNRALKEVKEAQSAATSAQKSNDAALLKQSNAIERARLQYQALANAIEDAGSTPMHLEAANKAFNDFAKAMSSGVLSAEEFSDALNKSNASLAMIKRGAGVEKALADAVGKTEEALKRQDVRLIAAKQKLDALARSVTAVGASSSLVTTAAAAYDQLDKVLKDTSTSAADASLAAAKYNNVLKEADRHLDEFVTAQRQAEKATQQTDAAMLKQVNKLADAAIQFENTKSRLTKLGAGATHINNLEAAFADFSKEMKSAALDGEKFSAAVNKWKKSLADIKRESGTAGGVSQLSDGLRELVQSSQLLLGPLSGVASRIQSLVGLVRTGGIAFASVVTGVLALGFAFYKSVIAGAAFEKQMGRINAILKATGNIALISGAEVESIVEKVGSATGAATGDIREAAAGLSTIVGMNEHLLESALKASQGLAKIGGGSIQTTFRNLAQALQDPANAFQTLTQYGVEFDEMEKKIITSLINRGKKTEAVAKIMEKLGPVTAAATGEANTLTSAWQEMFNTIDELLVTFANATGILGGLTTFIEELTEVVKDASEAIKILSDWWSKAGVVTPLTKEIKNLGGEIEDTSDRIDLLGSLLFIHFDKTTMVGKATGNLAKALGLTADAAAEEAIAAERAATAEEVHFRAMEDSIKNAFRLKVALKEAASEYVKLEQQHLPLITEQELMEQQLENLTSKYEMFKKVLIASGKTEEQAIAILGRLGDAIKINTNSIERYIDKQQQAITFAKLDAQIAASEGAAKRSLSLEQKILNELYASGAVLTANYGKGLAELLKIQPELRDRINETTLALEKANFEAANNAALKALNDQLRISKSNLDNARNSTIGAALALAILSKEIELLNRGLTADDQAWKDEIAAITEITKTDWAADMVKAQKDLEDQVKLANSAIQASTESIIGEAKAIAVAAKMQEMLNAGVRQGDEYWKEQIRLVKELVDAQFTAESNQRIKDMQAEAALQDHIMESLFQSERTRSRLVDLAQKEYELAQRYGDLQDPRAQKELALFKILQEREALLQHFQDLSGAIDSMFSKAEDAIVEFAQTGKIQIEDLVRSIAEDFFRLELRYLILDPLHDMMGKGLGALAGKAGGGSAAGLLGKGLGGADMLFKQPLPVIVMNDTGLLGGKENSLTKAIESSGGQGATCGCIGDALKATSTSTTDGIVDAVSGGNTDVIDAVTGNSGVDNVAIDIAEEVGGKIEKPLEDLADSIGKSIDDVGDVIRKPLEKIVPAVDDIAPAVKDGIMNLPGMDKISSAAAETMMTKIPSKLSPLRPFSEWEDPIGFGLENPFIKMTGANANADFMRLPANIPSGFGAMAQSGIFNQTFPPFTPGTGALTPGPLIPQFNQQYIQDVIDRGFSGMGSAGGSAFGQAASAIGGGDIFGGNAGLLGGDALSSVNDSVLSLKDTFSELSDTTTSVIDRFGEVTGSISTFATEGLDQAQSALTDFGTKALTDTATKATETAATTAQMGVTSSVASTQITALGTAASTAAAQLGATGAAGAAKSVVGAGSLAHILPGFAYGGWTGGGSATDFAGLVHKKEYVFDEEATRNIGISTLEQIRAAAKRGGGGRTTKPEAGHTQPTMSSRNPDSFKIVNVLDPGIVANYLATREGEQIIMNIMRRNNQGKR